MKQIIVLLLSAIVGVAIMSCKESGTNPPEEKPPGYQEDIPWPSLADSPWPMFRADPQNTGRSKFSGAQFGNVSWTLDSINTQTNLSITTDSNLILLSSEYHNPFLYFITKEGYLKKKASAFYGANCPTVTSDGKILLIAQNKINAISNNGSVISSTQMEQSFSHSGVFIDKDGNILYVGINKLHKMDKFGNKIWTLNNDSLNNWSGIISFSPSGENLYLGGLGLTKIDLINKKINWIYGKENIKSTMVDSKGNIYFHSKNYDGKWGLIALTADMKEKWIFDQYENKGAESYLAIDKNGNIIFDNIVQLFSISHTGKLNWKVNLNGSSSGFTVVDNKGRIYVTIQMNTKIALKVFDSSGVEILNWISPEGCITGNGIAVGYDCTIIPTWDSGEIFSIK